MWYFEDKKMVAWYHQVIHLFWSNQLEYNTSAVHEIWILPLVDSGRLHLFSLCFVSVLQHTWSRRNLYYCYKEYYRTDKTFWRALALCVGTNMDMFSIVLLSIFQRIVKNSLQFKWPFGSFHLREVFLGNLYCHILLVNCKPWKTDKLWMKKNMLNMENTYLRIMQC